MSVMTTLQILVAAWEWFKEPEHYTTGVFCRNSEGESYCPEDAERTCVNGATMKVIPGFENLFNTTMNEENVKQVEEYYKARRIIDRAAKLLYGTSSVRVNDSLGREAAKKVLLKAIELEKENHATTPNRVSSAKNPEN